MYDFSLSEKIVPTKYNVRVFNILDKEDADALANILDSPNIEVRVRNDYFSQENDSLYVHLEWKEYSTVKVSPFSEE